MNTVYSDTMMLHRSCLVGLSFLLLLGLLQGQGVAAARQLRKGKKKKRSSSSMKMKKKKSSSVFQVPGLAIVKSTKSFDDTLNDLLTILNNNANINIVAQIPHDLAAAGIGQVLSPNRLVVFGNPALGTPLMQQNRLVGIDLPQKMQVYMDVDEDGNPAVFVAYNMVEYLEGRHPGVDMAATFDTIANALANIASAAAGATPQDIVFAENVQVMPATSKSAKGSSVRFGKIGQKISQYLRLGLSHFVSLYFHLVEIDRTAKCPRAAAVVAASCAKRRMVAKCPRGPNPAVLPARRWTMAFEPSGATWTLTRQ